MTIICAFHKPGYGTVIGSDTQETCGYAALPQHPRNFCTTFSVASRAGGPERGLTTSRKHPTINRKDCTNSFTNGLITD